mmetsp:Transcript_67810/g.159621  ORF Transcript_67810/g.159621 Transcript_67810/m.159621 type:complete len:250 (-) Transcript_67810:1946-2695(-)
MRPFSTDKSSDGSVWMFHIRTSAGSTSTSAAFQLGSQRSPTPSACSFHFDTKLLRNSAVKGPVYAMKPPASTMLPMTNLRFFSNTSLAAFHRTLSFPRPASNFSARSSFTTQSSASASNWAAFRWAAASCASSAATLSNTSLSSAFLIDSFSSAAARDSSATASFAFLGSISRDTLPYTSIALTHMHKDIAADDTLFTFSATKSSLLMYFCNFCVSLALLAKASLSYVFRLSRNLVSFISFLASSQLSF